ncbi:hypothetical protein BKA63DRAFT_301027 [Paraphoma chrysanthemicola]|nr:hypothetical protein BKA63DRAFT_301027 [Paraphoma chrysanthemicola]
MAETNLDGPVWNPSSVIHGAERSTPPYHYAPWDQTFQPPPIPYGCPPVPSVHSQRPNQHRGNLQAYENYPPPSCPWGWQPSGRPRMMPSPYSGFTGEPMDLSGPADNVPLPNSQPGLRYFPPSLPQYSPAYDHPVPSSNSSAPFDRMQQYTGINTHAPTRNFGGPYQVPTQDRGSPPRPRQSYQHGRRPSQQESHRYSNRSFDRSERHIALPPNPAEYRPDGVQVQPTSNRRDFDNFSQDPFRLRSSSDVEEAAARMPPSSRARRLPRNVRPREFFRAPIDPNVPTAQQIQTLKEKLPRQVLGEILVDASTACDICAKDYSSIRVQPSEDEEVAVELPCGHRFGEFCIFQWFDTCIKYKNKVTCPMCRKQLIEPLGYPGAFFDALNRGPGWRAFANELRRAEWDDM